MSCGSNCPRFIRDRNLPAIGYYGKMKKEKKAEAYSKWKNREVQVRVVTRGLGLGINKPDVRFVIRNELPPSISAWVQECCTSGRDGPNTHQDRIHPILLLRQ